MPQDTKDAPSPLPKYEWIEPLGILIRHDEQHLRIGKRYSPTSAPKPRGRYAKPLFSHLRYVLAIERARRR